MDFPGLEPHLPAVLDLPRALVLFQDQGLESQKAGIVCKDEADFRKWNYYLEYCHAGFNMRNVGVAQAIYTRPNNLSLREPR